MSIDSQDQAAQSRQLCRFESVYTRSKGPDRYLLSVSRKPLEHKLGVNRTPLKELNGNKWTTTTKQSQTSQRIAGLLTKLPEDRTDLKPTSDATEAASCGKASAGGGRSEEWCCFRRHVRRHVVSACPLNCAPPSSPPSGATLCS